MKTNQSTQKKQNQIFQYAFIALLSFMFTAVMVFAVDKPSSANPLGQMQTLAMMSGDPALSIAGQACTNQYATSGEYCSGHIRQYYQCVPTVNGAQWEQRSENCETYATGGICLQDGGKASCEVGVTPHVRNTIIWTVLFFIISAGLIVLGIWFPMPMYFKIAAIIIGGFLLVYSFTLAQKIIIGGF